MQVTDSVFFQKIGILEKLSPICVTLATTLAITLPLSDVQGLPQPRNYIYRVIFVSLF